MKDKYEGCYIDGYKDHYAVFADNGENRNFRKSDDHLNSTKTLIKQQNSSVKQQMFHVKRRKEKRKKHRT